MSRLRRGHFRRPELSGWGKARENRHSARYETWRELGAAGELRIAKRFGTQAYLVQDAMSEAGVEIRPFNAAHL